MIRRLRSLLNHLKRTYMDKGDNSMKVDDKEVKNAFKLMLDKSKSNWGVMSPNSPCKKDIKRIGKNQPNSHGKSGSIRDWLRREQN